MENRIAALLNERGIRPAAFAKQIGVPSSTIYSIVNGKQNFEKIGIGTFIKIARGFGMDAEELYDGTYMLDPVLSEIKSTYRQTTPEGKRFMAANAKTVRELYPSDEAKNDGQNDMPDSQVSGVA